MTSSASETYSSSEKEEAIFRGFFNLGYKSSLTVGLTGLVGMLSGVGLINLDNSDILYLPKEIIRLGSNFSLFGGAFLFYFGVISYINPTLHQNQQEK